MKKIYLFLLFGLLLAACVKDDDKQPILVTDIVMPAAGTVFNPGDKVTIKAQGFQTDDDIMFEIYWPLPDEPALNYQGYARGVLPVMLEQTATSITFLAPGHYPASTTKILLRRAVKLAEDQKDFSCVVNAPKANVSVEYKRRTESARHTVTTYPCATG